MKLATYLSTLNSSDNSQGIWVNPDNIDEYRIGQCQFENGGLLDGWDYIGSLESLSYGFQSETEALESVLEGDRFYFGGKHVRVNKQGIIDAYFEDNLAAEFAAALHKESEYIMSQWATDAADLKVEELQDYYQNGEYEQAQLELAAQAEEYSYAA